MGWYCSPIENEITHEHILQMADEGRFHEWKFKPFEFSFAENGYEGVVDKLKSYTAEAYEKASDEEKEKIVDEVLAIYREIDLFPIQYYSDQGILNEIEKCIGFKAEFDGDTISTGAGVGTGLCRYLFPNIFDTPSKHDLNKTGAESMYAKFHNDKFLRTSIKFCFSYKNGSPVPTAVEGGLRLVGSAPSNFRPMNAKAVYERFCPEGGVIFDPCCGFGGRMLGCLTSKKNYKYVGTDPNTESMYHLHQLGEYIEQVTGRDDSYELHCCGSEDFRGKPESIDFAFSSPPYFDLEVYSDEPTQCYNKFPQLDLWLEGYVRQTIKNIGYMLKKGRLYAINIADFKVGDGVCNYVDEWIRISAEEGMPLYDTVYLGVTARAGSKEQAAGEKKKENILIFKKPM